MLQLTGKSLLLSLILWFVVTLGRGSGGYFMAVPFVRSRLDVFSTGPDVTSSDAEASLSTPLNLVCVSSDCRSKAGEPGENLSVRPGPGVQVWLLIKNSWQRLMSGRLGGEQEVDGQKNKKTL